jgi:hypothetical protein
MELCVTSADHHSHSHSHSHLISDSADILPQVYMISDAPDVESSSSQMTHPIPSYIDPIQSSHDVNGDSSQVTDLVHAVPPSSRPNSPASASALNFDDITISNMTNRIHTWDPPIDEDPDRAQLRRLIREEERTSLLALLVHHDSHDNSLNSIALSSEYSMSGPSGTDQHGNPYMDFLLFHSILLRKERSSSQHLVGSAYIRFHPTTHYSPPSTPSLHHSSDDPAPPMTNGHLYLPRSTSSSLSHSPAEETIPLLPIEDEIPATIQTMLLHEHVHSTPIDSSQLDDRSPLSYPTSNVRWMEENMLTDDNYSRRNLPNHADELPELLYPEYASNDPTNPPLLDPEDDPVIRTEPSTSFRLPGPYQDVLLTKTDTGWIGTHSNSSESSHDYASNISDLANAIDQARLHFPHPFEFISYPVDFADNPQSVHDTSTVTGDPNAVYTSTSESTSSDFIMYSPVPTEYLL